MPLKHHRSPGAWLLLIVTAVAYIALGFYSVSIMKLLIQWLSPGSATRIAAASNDTLTTRPLVPMVVYGGLYMVLSVLLLHLLLADRQRTRIVVLIYGALLATIALLLVVGRLTGLALWLTPPARALIDLITSPLPILFGLAAFFLVAPKR